MPVPQPDSHPPNSHRHTHKHTHTGSPEIQVSPAYYIVRTQTARKEHWGFGSAKQLLDSALLWRKKLSVSQLKKLTGKGRTVNPPHLQPHYKNVFRSEIKTHLKKKWGSWRNAWRSLWWRQGRDCYTVQIHGLLLQSLSNWIPTSSCRDTYTAPQVTLYFISYKGIQTCVVIKMGHWLCSIAIKKDYLNPLLYLQS